MQRKQDLSSLTVPGPARLPQHRFDVAGKGVPSQESNLVLVGNTGI